ncbi:MAG: superoxide dismutase [Fe] [Candidatus Sumerlaeota bacterium]|nr:superoxide dismutase [Fe] [Candidatus Sumerlaeota bacterium]
MSFQLPALPFARNALEPVMSSETLEYHYGKHHQKYLDTLNELTAGKPEANKTLEEIILASEGKLFNQAAQVWNHTFFWNCLTPNRGGKPAGALAEALKANFGSVEKFLEGFAAQAGALFGSGWTWLVAEGGKLKIAPTSNADLPMKRGQTALLTLDVWEHAYYIDYRNARPKYIDEVLKSIVNWDFVAANLAKAK